MLYLVYGEDTARARRKVNKLADQLLLKKPDASLQRIDDENFEESYIDSYIGGQGLFESRQVIVFDNLFADKSRESALLPRLKDFKHSNNIFIFLEGKMLKRVLGRFEAYAEKIQHFETPSGSVRKKFDIFTLTDALGKRDSTRLWVLYRKAKMDNISDEEIHGILFWQIKSMLLSDRACSADEAGLKPFVFAKAKSFVKNFERRDLESMSSSLVELYHDARRGRHELGSALEQFVLGV